MKVVILAGGFGTRLCEKTGEVPKTMVNIGDKPILWHVMRRFSLFGYNEFIIALGKFGEKIKRYFLNSLEICDDLYIDFAKKTSVSKKALEESWRIHFVDTGTHTETGGRLKRVSDYIGNKTFMLAYGDVVADIDIRALEEFHHKHGKLATLTSVQPYGRYGELELKGNQIIKFKEKPKKEWVSCGFFVLEPEVLQLLKSDETIWEKDPLESLASQGELMAYKHNGFWQPMDTLKDQKNLESLWNKNEASWLKLEKQSMQVYG